MSDLYSQIHQELLDRSSAAKAVFFPRFFKTGKGQYGEGDQFLGVNVPDQRAIGKKYEEAVEGKDINKLLDSVYHEDRLTGLMILVEKFSKQYKKDPSSDKWVKLYLKKIDRVNNWDLVDTSAPKILGCWLFDKDRSILYKFARSRDLWKNRIAIISTLYFIRKNELDDLLDLAEILIGHKHDLIHKAVGWMLREGWLKNPARIEKWLNSYKAKMPRTMLRYAIEKMEENKRRSFLVR